MNFLAHKRARTEPSIIRHRSAPMRPQTSRRTLLTLIAPIDGQTTDSGSMQKNLDALYAKKDVPSPDEVASGLKYELSNMTKKDKALAKEKVLTNLRKDPHYYGKLNHLNIDDKTMDMSPQAATDKIFQDIAEQRGTKKFAVNKGISDIIAEMRQKKKDRSAWKTDPKK
jgi:hypothetical protein